MVNIKMREDNEAGFSRGYQAPCTPLSLCKRKLSKLIPFNIKTVVLLQPYGRSNNVVHGEHGRSMFVFEALQSGYRTPNRIRPSSPGSRDGAGYVNMELRD